MIVRLSDFGCPSCTCIECIRGGGSRMYELPTIHVCTCLVQRGCCFALPWPPFLTKAHIKLIPTDKPSRLIGPIPDDTNAGLAYIYIYVNLLNAVQQKEYKTNSYFLQKAKI